MVSMVYYSFFIAMAGAGGALIGLLFVAISIRPQRTFGRTVRREQQYLAESALVSLLNGFIVTSVALISGLNVGGAALVMSCISLITTAHLAGRMAQYHGHGQRWHRSWLHLVRVTSISIVAFILFLTEFTIAWLLLLRPSTDDAMRMLALVVLGIYVVGLVRAWTLLGAPRYGISGWFNPLQDRGESTPPAVIPDDHSAERTTSLSRNPSVLPAASLAAEPTQAGEDPSG